MTIAFGSPSHLDRIKYPIISYLNKIGYLFSMHLFIVLCRAIFNVFILFQDAFTRSRKESDGNTFVPMKPNSQKVFT